MNNDTGVQIQENTHAELEVPQELLVQQADPHEQRTVIIQTLAQDLASALETKAQTNLETKPNYIREALISATPSLFAALAFSLILSTSLSIFILTFLVLSVFGFFSVHFLSRFIQFPENTTPEKARKDKFQAIRKSVGEIVDNSVKDPITTAVDDLYQIKSAMERYPEISNAQTQDMAQMIGQTLVAGSLVKEIKQYQKTRWTGAESSETRSTQLLNDMQKSLSGDLKMQEQSLVQQVYESTLQISLVRGEILRLEAEAIQSKRLSTPLEDIFDRVRSMRETMLVMNETASQKLLEIKSQ